MKNIIAAIAGVLVVGGAVWWGVSHRETSPAAQVPVSMPDISTPSIAVGEPSSTSPDAKVIAELQGVWKKYIAAVKAHDITTVRAMSFRQSTVCGNPSLQKECFELMDALAENVSDFKAEDLTLVWYDEKQAVLRSPLRHIVNTDNEGYAQSRVFFAKSENSDEYKVLAVMPDWGRFTGTMGATKEAVAALLEKGILDTDKDGLTDMEERCETGNGEVVETGCSTTDQEKRDTDGDEWWDGIEIYF